MTGLALLLIGFSLFGAGVLALTHFRTEHYAEQVFSRRMGLILLGVLSVLQLAHFAWLYADLRWIDSPLYRMALFAVAPAFFLFSHPLLTQASVPRVNLFLHAMPVFFCLALPVSFAIPVAFLVGAGYLIWLVVRLYVLRKERAQFRLEMLLLGAVFIVALAISALGFFQALLPAKLFFILYACAIGVAFFFVQLALGLRPSLAVEVTETVQSVSYISSTLNNVNCDAALTRLTALMEQRIFVEPGLSLPLLAQQLQLSTHQLSELLNSRLGKGFSRFLREARVSAAKTMLVEEPAVSVLAVGLSVGFTSQSTFYDAFREIEGMTPGQFRKLEGQARKA
ncbi:MAG TPA: helix-turn-helix domain-containing protein [Cellvibrionaceae bacterium]